MNRTILTIAGAVIGAAVAVAVTTTVSSQSLANLPVTLGIVHTLEGRVLTTEGLCHAEDLRDTSRWSDLQSTQRPYAECSYIHSIVTPPPAIYGTPGNPAPLGISAQVSQDHPDGPNRIDFNLVPTEDDPTTSTGPPHPKVFKFNNYNINPLTPPSDGRVHVQIEVHLTGYHTAPDTDANRLTVALAKQSDTGDITVFADQTRCEEGGQRNAGKHHWLSHREWDGLHPDGIPDHDAVHVCVELAEEDAAEADRLLVHGDGWTGPRHAVHFLLHS